VINWDDASAWSVLVVDDEPDNLELVGETLEYYGAEVKTAENGKVALEYLEAFKANLILADLSMPVMNGWDLRVRLKGNEKYVHIPVIALTAHAIAGDKERILEAGFDGYLMKPININTLCDDIRMAFVSAASSRKEIA
jgi:CheY-like chemotaxis protein